MSRKKAGGDGATERCYMTGVKQQAEGKSCVSIRMGITEPGSFTNLGRAAYGWEPWGCGLGQLGELKRLLKETRQRLEMQWMDEAATSIKLKTFYDSTNTTLGQEKK